jgi:hypothetical protein
VTGAVRLSGKKVPLVSLIFLTTNYAFTYA